MNAQKLDFVAPEKHDCANAAKLIVLTAVRRDELASSRKR
jgi:hypothetical protein